MSFLETPIFPGRVGAGAVRTLKRSVETIRTMNRRRISNVNGSQAWREYTFPMPAVGTTEFALLEAHYLACTTAHQFRFEDYEDYLVAQADGFLGQASAGTGMPTYQLHKRYVTGALTEWRAIRKPKSTGNTIYRNASPATAGASAGNYALDSTTGIVTWVADSSNTATSHTVGASHQVTLTAALAGLSIGGKLYLTGVTGTAAATLNGIAHTISNISSNTYTLSTTTTGLTATGGTGYKYPQPTDTLAWSGAFDVPVAYASELQLMHQALRTYVAQQVYLVEEYV